MNTVPLESIAARIGSETARSEWFTIDQDRISAFADATLDHQWIHVDEEAAEKGPFGATIAHGFLTLSLLPQLAADGVLVPDGVAMGLNYGANRVRFLNPGRRWKPDSSGVGAQRVRAQGCGSLSDSHRGDRGD